MNHSFALEKGHYPNWKKYQLVHLVGGKYKLFIDKKGNQCIQIKGRVRDKDGKVVKLSTLNVQKQDEKNMFKVLVMEKATTEIQQEYMQNKENYLQQVKYVNLLVLGFQFFILLYGILFLWCIWFKYHTLNLMVSAVFLIF